MRMKTVRCYTITCITNTHQTINNIKKTFITVALFAVLGTMAVSCQKENIDEIGIAAECNTIRISLTLNL